MLPRARPMMHPHIQITQLIPKFQTWMFGASAPKRSCTHIENKIDSAL